MPFYQIFEKNPLYPLLFESTRLFEPTRLYKECAKPGLGIIWDLFIILELNNRLSGSLLVASNLN